MVNQLSEKTKIYYCRKLAEKFDRIDEGSKKYEKQLDKCSFGRIKKWTRLLRINIYYLKILDQLIKEQEQLLNEN